MGSGNAVASDIMRELSAYIAVALKRPLPKDVAEVGKHHLLDTLAAMVSGSRLLPGRKAIAYARNLGGSKQALVVGTRLLTSTVNAALANGMMAHADETDDSHVPSLSHPGCGVVPAALAIGEHKGRDGKALLRAVVLGYDVCARSNFALGPEQLREAGHSSHSFGPLFRRCRCGGRSLRFECRPGEISALVYRPTGSGSRLLGARSGACRKGVRLRRHAGAKRRGGGNHGCRWIHGR